jgi:hypothetical protein
MTMQVKDLVDKLSHLKSEMPVKNYGDFKFNPNITKQWIDASDPRVPLVCTFDIKPPVYKENTIVTNVEVTTNDNKIYKLNKNGDWQETKIDSKPIYKVATDYCFLCGKKFNEDVNGFGNIDNYHYVCMEAIDHYSIKMCISMVDAEKKLTNLINSDTHYFNREIIEKSCFFGYWQNSQKSDCKMKKESSVTILK